MPDGFSYHTGIVLELFILPVLGACILSDHFQESSIAYMYLQDLSSAIVPPSANLANEQ